MSRIHRINSASKLPGGKKDGNSSASESCKSDEDEEEVKTNYNPLFGPRAALVEFLLSPDFEVLEAISEAVLLPEEDRILAEALLDFYEAKQKTRKVMEWAISKEVNNSTSSTTLFRGSNEATKFMSVIYSKLCRDYLKQLAGVLVKDITGSGGSFEVDPNRAEKGVPVKDNLKKVLAIAHEFLHHIYDSIDNCPPFVRQILWFAKKEVSRKFPESGAIIVGVFFFSRFLIPAIVSPHQFGLAFEAPTLEAQRGLILISKLLQNLSNGIVFDESKEEYTSELNKFIHTHMESLHQFLSKLAEEDNQRDFRTLYNVTNLEEHLALNVITNVMKEYQQKIYTHLIKPETKKTFIQLVEADLYKSSGDDKSSNNNNWSGTLRFSTPRKKKEMEKIASKNGEDKAVLESKIEKLEQSLSEEVKARKELEKKVIELTTQLSQQREVNEENSKAIALLAARLDSLVPKPAEE